MTNATFSEYQSAKNEIIFGIEYKEYSKLEGNSISKQYVTESNGTFYEVTNTETNVTEFWSDKHADSRYYSDCPELEKEVEVLSIGAKKTSENHYYITLTNNAKITIEKDTEYNGSMWAWKIENQIFSKDKYAEDYLKKLIAEKLTGTRIIYHKEKQVPEICGINGAACRHPRECNTMLCSNCPIALKFFADRDNVKLVYSI